MPAIQIKEKPTDASTLTKKDFQSDQEVRWCPGCGDYAILNSVQNLLPKLGISKENFVVVSGIGCSSRFPYYMDTYGFHSIHGRAPAIATGLKVMRPDLSVWVITGDGDGLSIGGNHLIHALRRNVGLKVILFNNKIYGLTKGQYSPTSELGKKTSSTPYGSVDRPFNPISLGLGADASFVARSVDVYREHLLEVLQRAAEHPGSAFVEVYQNCNIFNDKAFAYMTEKHLRDDQQVLLEPGKPLIFGAKSDKGIRRTPGGRGLEVVSLGDGVTPSDLLVHDPARENPSFAFELSRMGPPDFPTPIGIFRDVPTIPLEQRIQTQVQEAQERVDGEPDLQELLGRSETWTVS
jgi:2-oxoglutarate/2-oxoacid ferredoxin oxidoreductase subunit beta